MSEGQVRWGGISHKTGHNAAERKDEKTTSLFRYGSNN
jgi:hypothetical protein